MAAKEVRFSGDARQRMLRGVTFSPTPSRSRSAPRAVTSWLDKSFGAPRITKDGVTVAKRSSSRTSSENMGAQLVREVARRPTTSPRRHDDGDRARPGDRARG